MAPLLSNECAAELDVPTNVPVLKAQLDVSCRAFRRTHDCIGVCACSSHGNRYRVDSSRLLASQRSGDTLCGELLPP